MSRKPELAKDLESVRAELARLVVRDMKSPLAGLANLLEMADRASVKHVQDDASRYVNDALGATETLEELVELLIGVRKFMAGEGAPDKRGRDLFTLARAIADGLSEAAQAAGGGIVVTGDPVTVYCDADQISRVVRHLIRCALKAGGKGSTVTVQVGRRDGVAGVSVECMPARDAGAAPVADGLGLTYCRLVMEAHQGSFLAGAEPGKPCRWLCELPEARGMVAEPMEKGLPPVLEPSRRYLGPGDGMLGSDSGQPSSIASRGTREQFGVAVALMSAIPLLAFSYLLGDALCGRNFDVRTLYLMLPSVVALVALGVVLLARHTLEVASLRKALESMAKGEMPRMSIKGGSKDFLAIQRYLGSVIQQTNDRIRVIESQSKALVQAEQQRVMSETVGAACHHLGQPATVIRVYLDLMKKVEGSPEMQKMIQECQSAAEEVAEILHRLKGVGEYRTEPYLGADEEGKRRGDERILKI